MTPESHHSQTNTFKQHGKTLMPSSKKDKQWSLGQSGRGAALVVVVNRNIVTGLLFNLSCSKPHWHVGTWSGVDYTFYLVFPNPDSESDKARAEKHSLRGCDLNICIITQSKPSFCNVTGHTKYHEPFSTFQPV